MPDSMKLQDLLSQVEDIALQMKTLRAGGATEASTVLLAVVSAHQVQGADEVDVIDPLPALEDTTDDGDYPDEGAGTGRLTLEGVFQAMGLDEVTYPLPPAPGDQGDLEQRLTELGITDATYPMPHFAAGQDRAADGEGAGEVSADERRVGEDRFPVQADQGDLERLLGEHGIVAAASSLPDYGAGQDLLGEGDDENASAAHEVEGEGADGEAWLDAVGAELNAELRERIARDAHPQTLTLSLIWDREGPLPVRTARECVDRILASVTAVVGEATPGDARVDGDAVLVDLALANPANVLTAATAGMDVFNAADRDPATGAAITIASRVGDIADPELAEEMGLAPIDLPEPGRGGAPINAVRDILEEAGQVVPEVTFMKVTYTRQDGQELTTEQVATILDHPASQSLARLGVRLLHIVEDPEGAANVKIAEFTCGDGGDIDPATLALGASAYQGAMDFGPQIGRVHACGSAVLDA